MTQSFAKGHVNVNNININLSLAANNLIKWAKKLTQISPFPDAVNGESYDCACSLVEYLIGAIKALVVSPKEDEQEIDLDEVLKKLSLDQKRKVAERIMGAIVALNLPQDARPVELWKDAIANWQHHKGRSR